MTGHQVANAAQAALLLDVTLRPLLGFLMHAPRSASEVAAHLDVNLQRAHYLLGKLVRAGVAEVVNVQPRAGRAVKWYRVAPRWFIPFEITGAETLEAFLAAQILPRMARFVQLSTNLLREHQPTWGYWLEQGPETSNLRMGDLGGTAEALFVGDEPFLLNIGNNRLSRERAAELKRRLIALLEEFSDLETAGAPEYTIGLMLVRGGVD
ncbi:winged helix-turn-helix domain-containing protein [Deinococcus aluminii]|uniref:ArsR family transcriptional regulator n=1 Tax=Deinococcus aluminii TaxID=1656885 RepID=A0ABP9XEM0_9DEIO